MAAEANVDRYELIGELATGGMATVYLGRQRGPFGFARTVAIKSMHAHIAKDEGFRAMFLDEATLTARIRHPNVVPTLDVVAAANKVLLVMEYIEGVSLATLMRRAVMNGKRLDPAICSAIVGDALRGLHAAHELRDDEGNALNVVHRDVSPQNIHVGVDGMARVLDFGVAKASTRRYQTASGEIKGKLAYMSNEQCCGEHVDLRTDVYAAGVVLWEMLTGRRLITASNEGEFVKKVIEAKFDKPSVMVPELAGTDLEHVVMKALSEKRDDRWLNAEAMADALAKAEPPAVRTDVAALVRELASEELAARSQRLRKPESGGDVKAIAELLTEHATETMKPGEVLAGRRGSRRFRSVLTVAGGALLVLALVGGAFTLGARRSHEANADPPLVTATTTATASAPPAVSVPAPVSATPSVAPVASSAVAAPVPAPKPRHRTGAAKPDCRIPYVVDANGDRHYRSECVN